MSDAGALLTVRGLDVVYGHVPAVRGLNLEVDAGQIAALLGANGAGKTSTLRGITGLVRPRNGTVVFDGHRVEAVGPTRIVELGVAHVPEGRRVFPGLTVADNLMLGGWAGRRRGAPGQHAMVFDLFPRLAERRTQLAGQLSGGEQQMLAIGRALMSQPRLLLIDELSLGLAPLIVDELFDRLVLLNREGVAVVLIEQFVHRALDVADRVYLLAKGRLVFDGTADEARRSDAIESAYLMGEVTA